MMKYHFSFLPCPNLYALLFVAACPRPAHQQAMFFSLLFVFFAVSVHANHAHPRRSLAIIRRQGILGNLADRSDARASLLPQHNICSI